MARSHFKSSWVVAGLGFAFLAPSASAQVFVDNTTDIPQSGSANNSSTENVDFGDVDGDGDWDAIFADGGDDGQDQNRIWINQGGSQGGSLGVFVDQTGVQFPSVQQGGRDIEFVDFDDDGDLDIYSSNTSRFVPQTNRWWTNNGGTQGGTEGFYTDETAMRWVGLGGAGSSIAANQLIGGGFIDWSCDCDFGDLDNDGDMDLVHSSYGGAFQGDVPTRIFLNDGSGLFSEFNPSGFQLTTDAINNGNPGLWCEGTQQTDTTNSTGQFCDIASSALDIDLGDIDGDFDLDILHGARQELPRMFENRLEENGGTTLGFRDTTGAAFPSGYSVGDGHYEQEMADMDGDGDLDIYGLNWRVTGGFGGGFTDITLRGLGNGIFDQRTDLPGSGSDDNEGDFIDYDLDGDMDLFVANFLGQDRLYRNNNNGGSTFSYTEVTAGNIPGSLLATSPTSLDADVCDVDDDGDYDIIVAADDFDRNVLLTNTTNPASGTDQHAPYVPNVEQAPNRMPSADPTVIRAQVYDNAPYYITWYIDVEIRYTVDAGPVQTVPMKSSGGQIFRGELPGNLTGTICYTIAATDRYNQTGLSSQLCYTSGGGGPLFTEGCNGDGGDQMGCTDCPCSNNASIGTVGGCLNSFGTSGRLVVSGSDSISAGDLRVEADGMVPSSFMVLTSGNAIAPTNAGNPCFGQDSGVQSALLDGLRCAVQQTQRHGGRPVASNGTVGMGLTNGYGPPNGPPGGIGANAGFSAGQTRHFQGFYRELPGTGCLTEQNTTQAVTVNFTP